MFLKKDHGQIFDYQIIKAQYKEMSVETPSLLEKFWDAATSYISSAKQEIFDSYKNKQKLKSLLPLLHILVYLLIYYRFTDAKSSLNKPGENFTILALLAD